MYLFQLFRTFPPPIPIVTTAAGRIVQRYLENLLLVDSSRSLAIIMLKQL